MNRGMSRIAPVVAIFAAIAALTGCDSSIYQSPGGIRLDGDHVEIALCETVVGAEIRVFGDASRGVKAEDYIWATGDIVIRPEEHFTSAVPRADWDVTIWTEPKVNPGARVALFVYDTEGSVVFPIEFSIPDSGLSETLWTRANGSQVETPCD